MLARVDRSFSPVRLGTTTIPSSLRKNDSDAYCKRAWEPDCGYFDAARVKYDLDFADSPGIAIKSIEVGPANSRSLPALGIGKRRKFASVMAQARRFLPIAQFRCEREIKDVVCSAMLGEGWLTLRFTANELRSLRLEAYHFT
jgi:hypothetical protein